MSNRIGPDAFAYYTSLGPDRSYEQVAKFCGVSKRSVARAAARENWTPRLAKIEADAQARSDARLADELEDMQTRHTRLLRAMAARAAKAIAEYPLRSCLEGAKVAEMVIKLERVIAGQVAERTSVSVEAETRQQFERFLAPAKGSPEDDSELDGEPDGDEDW